jgi:hypothetical protein
MRRASEFPFWRPGDLLVLAVLAVPTVLLTSPGGRGDAETATVLTTSGTEVTVPLDTDSTFTVEGHLGELVLEVRDGSIRVESSPCPGQHCVHMEWARTGGDAIVCVPSGVCVRLDPPPEGGVDAVTY